MSLAPVCKKKKKRSINDIIAKCICDFSNEKKKTKTKSSPILPWLKNVIDLQLNYDVNLSPEKLFQITNDMFLTYCITIDQKESMELCTRIVQELSVNGYTCSKLREFQIDDKVECLFTDGNWYEAKVRRIEDGGYWVVYRGYEEEGEVRVGQGEMRGKREVKVSIKEKEIAKTKDCGLELIMHTKIEENDDSKKKYHNTLIVVESEEEEEKEGGEQEEEEEKEAALFASFESKWVEDDEPPASGKRGKENECSLCKRVLPLTWHHLVPKTTHKKMLKEKNEYTKDFLNKNGIWVCRQCHSAVHGLYDNLVLAKQYNTLQALKDSQKVQKWIHYAQKQKVRGYSKTDKRLNTTNKIAFLQKHHDKTFNVNYVS